MSRIQKLNQQVYFLFSRTDARIRHLSLPFFIWLRWCFAAVYLAAFTERFLDADYITKTSLAYFGHLRDSPHFLFFGNLLLGSPDVYRVFLTVLAVFAVLYANGSGGLWIPVLFFAFEFVYQIVSAGNLYGHEGFIHQFLLLMVLIEIGQGRIRHTHIWSQSRLSGLAILLLRWQLMVLYFMAGLGKILSPDWQSGEILNRIFFNTLYNRSVFDAFYANSTWAPPVLKYVLIGFQILFPLLIFIRPLRRWLFAAGIVIHTFIAIKMDIYFFSFFVVSLYLLFCDEDCKIRMSSQNGPDKPSL